MTTGSKKPWAVAFLIGALSFTSVLGGCSRKERVVDVDAPGLKIKVDRDKDSGAVDIDVDRTKK
jgi:hypothetical protein